MGKKFNDGLTLGKAEGEAETNMAMAKKMLSRVQNKEYKILIGKD